MFTPVCAGLGVFQKPGYIQMLLQFSAENFLSIKNKITLSMLATNDKSLDQNLIKREGEKNCFLKTIAIYGANAAGKSNIIKAMGFMRRFVITCSRLQPGDPIGVMPFQLDWRTPNSPSSFDIAFVKDNIRYLYGFKLDSTVIHEEYLYCYPNGRRAIVFERRDTNIYRFSRNNEEQKTLSGRTLDNTLYLTASAGWNYRETVKVLEWFKKDLIISDSTSVIHALAWKDFTGKLLITDQEMRNRIERIMKIADFGITELKADIISATDDKFPKNMPDSVKRLIIDRNMRRIDVQMGHKTTTEHDRPDTIFFDLSTESMGTIKLFSLAGRWIEALKHGRVLVLDELDSSLHPAILDRLLNQFHTTNTNQSNAQLIFTTHNMHLLSLDRFRRDQIWFVEKDPDAGATDLYSLAEIKGVRKDENIAKGYINGRYGAVPFLSGWLEP